MLCITAIWCQIIDISIVDVPILELKRRVLTKTLHFLNVLFENLRNNYILAQPPYFLHTLTFAAYANRGASTY